MMNTGPRPSCPALRGRNAVPLWNGVVVRRLDALQRQLDQLRTVIAPIKAAHVRNAPVREAASATGERHCRHLGSCNLAQTAQTSHDLTQRRNLCS